MKVELKRVNDATHYEATGQTSPVKVHIDGSESMGGQGLGPRPMELVLMALGSCGSFDLVNILKKQKQQIEEFSVTAEGQRADSVPSVFTAIHLTFHLKGTIDRAKAERAAALAVEKYCSVHHMLVAGGVNITYSLDLQPAD